MYALNYSYGCQRVDQTNIIDASDMFRSVVEISSSIIHMQEVSICVKARKSHATLVRLAGSQFDQVIKNIKEYLASHDCKDCKKIKVPYQINTWLAQINE